jgi:hypothetical protein
MFKKKQDWMEERLGRLNRPQDLPTLHRPAADLGKESISTAAEGNNPIETWSAFVKIRVVATCTESMIRRPPYQKETTLEFWGILRTLLESSWKSEKPAGNKKLNW